MEVLDYTNIRLELDGPLATLILADPDHLNAISPAMAESFMRALQEASKPRRGVRALMLTGEGRGFCAGANLTGRVDDFSGEPPVQGRVEAVFHPLIRRLRDFDKPVIAAVGGACVGLGVALCCQADYVVASEAAYFATPFLKLGTCPDCGLTWMLPRIIGPMRARRLFMGLERITARDAENWGLVSVLLPEEGFAAAARDVAMRLAEGPTIALSETRRLIQEGMRGEFDAHLETELRALARTFRSKDNRAGLKAFAAKTKPQFTGE